MSRRRVFQVIVEALCLEDLKAKRQGIPEPPEIIGATRVEVPM